MHYGALPKKTSIKGQPHELSYITPQEAGILRMLGGSGENFNGVPAYVRTDDYVSSNTSNTSNRYDTIDYGGGNSLGEGQDTITASTYFKNDKDDNNNNVKEETPKSFFNFNKQENENFLTSLALNFKWAKDMNEEYQIATNPNYVDPNAITQTNIGSTGQVGDLSEEQTRLLGDTTETFVNPNTMVMEKYGKILMSTPDGTGNFTNEYYDDAEEFEALNPGFDAPTGGNVGIYDSNDLNANDARRTRPVDTTGFMEDVKAAKNDFFGLFSGDPLGNQEQNFFVPGYGDVMATSAAEAYEQAQFFKDNPELAASYAKGLGAPDFVTGDTDGDGIMDTYSGGGDVRVGDAITDPSLYEFPAQANKFDADGFVYDDEFFAGSGSESDSSVVDAYNQSMLDTYGFDYTGTNLDGSCATGYSKVNGVCTKDKDEDEDEDEDGFFTPVVDFFEELFTGEPPEPPINPNGGGDGGGSFPKKRDVYGNPIRLTKGGTSWWKMAANWTNPSERIDAFVTIDKNGNYVTSDGKLVPEDLIATALMTPTDLQIQTGTEEYQVPYTGTSNMPTDYNALYSGDINQEPLPVLKEKQVLNVSDPIIKP